MQDIQGIFAKNQEMKKEQKKLKDMYKDALAQTDEYEEVILKIKELREKKKEIEIRIQSEMGRSWEKLDDIKHEMESNKEMMTDIAITTLMDGKTVEVKDEYENNYEPIFSVRFKKSQDGYTTDGE